MRHRKRWLVVALLFSLSLLNYLDRQTLSVLAPTLRREFGFGTVEYSYIVTAFLAAYTLGFTFSGRVLDAIGVKLGTAIAVAFWSVAGMMHSVAGGWIGLAACRFLLGLGESFNTPAGAKAIADWTPIRERALSMAIFSNGYVWGSILAPPFVSYIALRYGWQWGFLATGAIGFVWLLVWWRFYETPERHKSITAGEREYILQSRETLDSRGAPMSWRGLIANPACRSLFIARLLTDPIPYFFTFWLPEYLQSNRDYTLAMVGMLGWIPFLASDIGGPGGGALSDWLVRRGWPPRLARSRVMLGAACLMPLAVLAVRVDSASLSLGLIAILLAAHSCWITNLLTVSAEGFPRSQAATVVAFASMGGSVGGMISTLLTGRVISGVGYAPVFTVLGFLHLSAWMILHARKTEGD